MLRLHADGLADMADAVGEGGPCSSASDGVGVMRATERRTGDCDRMCCSRPSSPPSGWAPRLSSADRLDDLDRAGEADPRTLLASEPELLLPWCDAAVLRPLVSAWDGPCLGVPIAGRGRGRFFIELCVTGPLTAPRGRASSSFVRVTAGVRRAPPPALAASPLSSVMIMAAIDGAPSPAATRLSDSPAVRGDGRSPFPGTRIGLLIGA